MKLKSFTASGFRSSTLPQCPAAYDAVFSLQTLWSGLLRFAGLLLLLASLNPLRADKPNILWLTSEDHGPQMGCYGDSLARTPNVDALAALGMRYRMAWSVSPVCAPARTAIISGLYPGSLGASHMRSLVPAPAGKPLYPQQLREAGYYCTNNEKTDYNLTAPADLWDECSSKASWRNRPAKRPFFAIFNSLKSHEAILRQTTNPTLTDPARVRLPAYHPDTPEVRRDWAAYYDGVSAADADAGVRLRELAAAGLAEDTIVFYYADHGAGLARSKRSPMNSGLQVPLVVYFPPRWRHLAPREYAPGAVSDRLVSFVDFAPTLLSLAGIRPPEWMQGRAFAGVYEATPAPFLYGERGRMDESAVDLVRTVTDGRYVYLRNYYPHVSPGQRVAYQFRTATTRVWYERFLDGSLRPEQTFFWSAPKPVEELYDRQSDPDEVHNLADSSAHRAMLETLREANRAHLSAIRDVAFLPEAELHTRAPGLSPYDLARDPARYPFERIYAMAETASGMDPTAVSALATALSHDPDSAVRFWAALGLLMRGPASVQPHAAALQEALGDVAADVKIIAAQALLQSGPIGGRDTALAVLADLCDYRRHPVMTSLAALGTVDALGPAAATLQARMTAYGSEDPAAGTRYAGYVPTLLQRITKPAAAPPSANAWHR
jgi:arylsulfatase A-like enzyme